MPSYATVTITGPDGNYMSSITTSPGRNDAWDSGALAAGTYTVRVADRRLDVGKVTLTLSKPADVGVLARGGAAVKATVGRPGQNIHASFTAKAGDDLSLEVAANTFTSSLWAGVLAPSGTAAVSFRLISAGASGSIALTDLAEAGTYKVRLNPTNAATGSINLSLKAAAAAAKTHAFTSNVRVSVKSACRAERLARTLAI
ncbi:hypothetical protein, partial [Streptomyces sp. WAC04114]|uniref:hypothetical protein n=1 Tax=Streptomyces sp. WAC04114 TaxID=2867961 RepID=UPI001C8CEFEC